MTHVGPGDLAAAVDAGRHEGEPPRTASGNEAAASLTSFPPALGSAARPTEPFLTALVAAELENPAEAGAMENMAAVVAGIRNCC
jgi:hypothetical protein